MKRWSNNFKNLILAAMSFVVFTTPVSATNPVQVVWGEIGTAGTGCPGGIVDYNYMAARGVIKFFADESGLYRVMAGGSTGKRIDRKTCNIALPVQVAAGYSVGIAPLPLLAWGFLPSGSSVELTANYFFPGFTGPTISSHFNNDYESGYDVGMNVFEEGDLPTTVGDFIWSPCGQDTILRLNTALLARANEAGEEVVAGMGSAIGLRVAIRQCY